MLITFEGIDGSGKSTQIRYLTNQLEEQGYIVCSVREPGGTELSERIRSILLDSSLEIAPFAELLLFSGARAQVVVEQIRPALERGEVVICDRFYDSTTAYQGAGRGVASLDWIRSFNLQVTGGLIPDRTYWLDLPIVAAQKRRDHRTADRMELADVAFFERVIEAYQELTRSEPSRFLQLDATLTPQVLHQQIWSDLVGLLQMPTQS